MILAVYAPWFTRFTPRDVTNEVYAGLASPGVTPYELPSANHPLGTTFDGFDILGRLIWGARTAMVFGFIASTIASVGGVAIGTVSAYYGGKIDEKIMRVIDFVIIFPTTLTVILIIQLTTNPSLLTMLVVFGLFGITGYARLMRASCLEVRKSVFIEAAQTGGASNLKVMWKHIIPNAISPILIAFFGGVGAAILGFSGIAFLGFGDHSRPDWGTDISYASSHFQSAIHASLWPGIFILITVLGFMLLGDGLRDVFDPRIQQRITMRKRGKK